VRKLILSLAALISFSFCLSVQAGDTGPKTNKQDTSLRNTFGAFVISGGVIYAVEQGGEIIKLDHTIRKSVELMTVLAATGWVTEKGELTEAAVKVPLVLATQKFASSEFFQALLTKAPILGDSLRNMGDDLKPLASMATYNLVTLPTYDWLRLAYVDKWLGIAKQKH